MNDRFATDRAMILARGLGTRMQKQVEGLHLDKTTEKLASQGAKGLIPIGRPFLDHTLQALLEAGLRDFCLIVAPGDSAIRDYYETVAEHIDGATMSFAEQAEPIGTANAVAAGKAWAADKPFLVLNSDNFYSPPTVAALASAEVPATVAYEREALIAGSNIPPDRIKRFAVVDIDEAGHMRRIIEKPDDPDAYAVDGKLYVSMNCFLFDEKIFEACAKIPINPVRNEYELPAAVQYCIDELGQTFRAVKVEDGVLDLTGRADIEPVRRMLAGHKIGFPAPAGWEEDL